MFALLTSFMRMTGGKDSGEPGGKFERKPTTGEFSNRKLSCIVYSLCY